MQEIRESVLLSVHEITDFAISLILANLNITDTVIHQNDIFLTASSSSVIGVKNTTIFNIQSTGKMI